MSISSLFLLSEKHVFKIVHCLGVMVINPSSVRPVHNIFVPGTSSHLNTFVIGRLIRDSVAFDRLRRNIVHCTGPFPLKLGASSC